MRKRFRRSKGIPKLSAGYGQQGGCRRRGLRADQARRAPSRADGLQARVQKAGLHAEGQSRAEIDAVADAIPVDCIIVAPAYPKIGRTTRNGIHYVNDVRIDRTETAKDPKSPVAEADLVKLLASQSQRQAGLLPLEALRAGAEAASLRIGKLLRSGIEIIVCDAVSDEDLRRIADVAAAGVGRMLWAGSAGLAECLPVAGRSSSAIRKCWKEPKASSGRVSASVRRAASTRGDFNSARSTAWIWICCRPRFRSGECRPMLAGLPSRIWRKRSSLRATAG